MKCIPIILLSMAVLGFAEKQQSYQQLDDTISNVEKVIKKALEDIQQQLEIPDQGTIVNNLKQQYTNFAKKVETHMKEVSAEVQKKNPDLYKHWTDATDKLNKVVQDIIANAPNAKKSAEQFMKQFQEGFLTLVEKSKTIVETLKADSENVKGDFASFTKKAIEFAVNAMKDLSEELNKASEKKNRNTPHY